MVAGCPLRGGRARVVALFVLLMASPLLAQSVVINEFVASNINGWTDEDGDTSDWLELYNPSATAVSLDSLYLSDDPDLPRRWALPAIEMPPGAHTLVFASGKDRRWVPSYWQTVLDTGTVWRYRANLDAPPAGWQLPGFDDSAWASGPVGIGYGDGDDATVVPPCISVSLRTTFTVADPTQLRRVCLHLDYDDGVVVWLNGERIYRANLTADGDPAWDQYADYGHEAALYRGLPPASVTVYSSRFQAGENVLAVEVHTTDDDLEDLTAIPILTFGTDTPPPPGTGPSPIIARWLPQMHTDFKISAEGETLLLVHEDGTVLDQVETGTAYTDVSRGRWPDGGDTWYYFPTPTPGAANTGGASAFADPPTVSPPGGLYDGPVTVTLGDGDPDIVIRYTLDGSVPDPGSPVYTAPLLIDHTVALRAVAFCDSLLPSRPATHTYILDQPTTLPTTALVTDPANLWDPATGIFVEENIYEDWERPLHLEYFTGDGSAVLSRDLGVKLFGNYSRIKPQKSLRMIPRVGYDGHDSLDYPFFAERPFGSFAQLVWRNSGNDFGSTHLRDAFFHRLVSDIDVDRLAYQPTRTYINGEYWGIYNIRERIDADYLAANHGLDPDAIDLMKGYFDVAAGSGQSFWDMWNFLETHDLADPAAYDSVRTMMETDEFADYQGVEIFCANTDWGINNIAWWRPSAPGGRWRWILYDTDAGLGLQQPVTFDAVGRALDDSGDGYPDPAYRNFIFLHLLESPAFRQAFVDRLCDHLNTTFRPEHSLAVFEAIVAEVSAEMPRHRERWENDPDWESRLQVVRDFLTARPDIVRQHLREHFGLGPDITLDLAIAPAGGGSVKLAAVAVDSAWSGRYFAGHPLALTAVAAPGYRFDHWNDDPADSAAAIQFAPAADTTLVAHFTVASLPGMAVINEINYNSCDEFDPGDWVELHNPGAADLDLSGWVVKDDDDDHAFPLPDGTVLPAGGYLVLCQHTDQFTPLFPGVTPVPGDLGFGLSGGGDAVRLYDGEGTLVDCVVYDDAAPWPTEPDGDGPTLELIDPLLDNALPQNWRASAGHGSPGAANGTVVAVGGDTPPFRLSPAHPNPANPRTRVVFSLDRRQSVRLSVYDLTGRRVRTLVSGVLAAGSHTVSLDGADDSGRPAASGTYLLRLAGAGRLQARKVSLVR